MSKTSTERQRYSLSGPTMATRWSAEFYAPRGVDFEPLQAGLAAALEAVEAQMSHWRPESDLNRLNCAPLGVWVALPEPLLAVLSEGLRIGQSSGGGFDLAMGDLARAWGFGPPARQPDPQAIRALTGKPRVLASEGLELAPGRARRLAPLSLDLSGIAKGFGTDELARVLELAGIEEYLVGIDGEMRARGSKPGEEGWTLALEAPSYEPAPPIGMIVLDNCAIATSGDYRNYVQLGAVRLSHAMDPRAARPVQNAVASVSVMAPSCLQADAWATALMVLGSEAGAALARQNGLDALFVERTPSGFRQIPLGRFG